MNIRKQQGFTIIEVVLVLAIAGLIFLMVFIALPTLQANQRDTQRRDDVSRMQAQLIQFQTNNKGNLPAAGCSASGGATTIRDFIDRYLDGAEFKDPDGTEYRSTSTTAPDHPRCLPVATEPTKTGQWRYVPGNLCDGESITTTGATARSYAIQMKLEGSGIFCSDNK